MKKQNSIVKVEKMVVLVKTFDEIVLSRKIVKKFETEI